MELQASIRAARMFSSAFVVAATLVALSLLNGCAFESQEPTDGEGESTTEVVAPSEPTVEIADTKTPPKKDAGSTQQDYLIVTLHDLIVTSY